MEILTVTPERIPDLVSSVGALFCEDGGRRDPAMDLTWPQRDGPAYYADLVADPDAVCLLAVAGAGVVGHLAGRLRRRDPVRPQVITAVLESLRVVPELRRTGAATELVEAFTAWAQSHRADYREVTAYAANRGALAFYRRLGFVDFERTLRAQAGVNR